MQANLEADFGYYLKHKPALVRKYRGKYVVIRDGTVLGAYDDQLVAISETSKTHELGTFIVQHCLPGRNADRQVYHSRVVFVS